MAREKGKAAPAASSLSTEDFASLASAQLGALGSTDIGALTTADVLALGTGQLVALSTDVIAALNTAPIVALITSDMAALSTSGLIALESSEIVSMSNAEFSALNADRMTEDLTAEAEQVTLGVNTSALPALTILEQLVAESREAQSLGDYTMHAEIEGLIDSLHSLKMRLASSTTLPAALVEHLESLL